MTDFGIICFISSLWSSSLWVTFKSILCQLWKLNQVHFLALNQTIFKIWNVKKWTVFGGVWHVFRYISTYFKYLFFSLLAPSFFQPLKSFSYDNLNFTEKLCFIKLIRLTIPIQYQMTKLRSIKTNCKQRPP